MDSEELVVIEFYTIASVNTKKLSYTSIILYRAATMHAMADLPVPARPLN